MAQNKAAEPQADNVEDVVDELPPGTKLLRGQYTIVRFLNSGGFGITYLAKDSLDRNVVIKECFPSSYCRRSKTVVAARSRAHTAELRSVVQLFVREARNLAKIVHPNIVAVHQVFEDNFTAYMAIDYIDGLDLQEVIEGKEIALSPQEIVVITEKLLGAVGFIHDHDMLHRDISPDNVLIDKTGEPILIDFGAARDEASQKNRAMSALRVVKDGYSPQEFYIAGSEQGPWSDLYALGATLYHLISGDAPTNGQARLAALAEGRPDPYVPLDGRFAGYPPGFLKAIDKAMNTLPAQRVQSASAWLAMFPPSQTVDGGIESAVRSLVAEAPAAMTALPGEPMSMADDEDYADEDGFGGPSFGQSQAVASTSPPAAAQASPTGRSGVPMIAAGVVLLIAALGGGYMMMGGEDAPQISEEVSTEAPDNATAGVTGTASTTETAGTTETAETTETASAVETASTTEVEDQAAVEEPVTAELAETTTESAATVETTSPEPEETDVATADPAAEGSTIAAPAGTLAAVQVGFAAWDAKLPFIEENRIVGGVRVAVVSRILPSINLAEAGEWLAPGVLLYTVNGNDIQQNGSVIAAVLNSMKVDPDGKARVVVEFAGSSLDRESGLLTVQASRLLSLSNGVNLRADVVDGKWQTVVTGVTMPDKTELRQGDILFRDKTTGIAIDAPDSLETVLAQLVEADTSLTTFSILRDSKLETAAMQLAVEP